MCKFCDKESMRSLKSLNEVCSIDVYMNKYFDLVIENMELDEVFELNFCPVCGRKLRKTLIEDKVLANGFYDGSK